MTVEHHELPAEVTISSGAAARALAQDHRFLGQLLSPQSPSYVATRLGMAANLAHHHARKLVGLGLLREERREGRRVYFVLTARQFCVPMDLLPPGDPDEHAVRTLRELNAEFLNANARSWSYASGGEGACYGSESEPAQASAPLSGGGTQEAHPAHLDTLTLRLTPERYRKLALALSELLSEAAEKGASNSGEVCTLAILGFRDDRPEKRESIGRGVSSFLPWPLQQ